jgi:hypothetical protein
MKFDPLIVKRKGVPPLIEVLGDRSAIIGAGLTPGCEPLDPVVEPPAVRVVAPPPPQPQRLRFSAAKSINAPMFFIDSSNAFTVPYYENQGQIGPNCQNGIEKLSLSCVSHLGVLGYTERSQSVFREWKLSTKY